MPDAITNLIRGGQNRCKYDQTNRDSRRTHAIFITDLYTLHPKPFSERVCLPQDVTGRDAQSSRNYSKLR